LNRLTKLKTGQSTEDNTPKRIESPKIIKKEYNKEDKTNNKNKIVNQSIPKSP